MLTKDRRQVFSRRAPTQPVKPIRNVTVPTQMSANAGSSARLMPLVRLLLNISFSVSAQIPTANMPNPNS